MVRRVRPVWLGCGVRVFGSSGFSALAFFFVCRSFCWEVFLVSVSSSLSCVRVVGSPVCGLSAPFVGSDRVCAVAAGASFLCLRLSSRSFSGGVVVSAFSSFGAASLFARSVCRLFPGELFSGGASFVVLRRCGSWWCVSVPCFLVFPVVPGSCLCSWVAL